MISVLGIVAALIALAALLLVAGRLTQILLTRVLRHAPYAVSERARELHAGLTIVDLHADALLWKRDLLRRNRVGQADLPRLVAGNVAVQVFAAVTKFPGAAVYRGKSYNIDLLVPLAAVQFWPFGAWTGLKYRALYQARRLHRLSADSNGRLRILKAREDLDAFLAERRERPDILGGILAIEGVHCLEERIENLDELFHAGFRLAGLVHFCDNAAGGSSNGVGGGGLTPFGRAVVARMEALSMIVDLAHASPRLIDDVLGVASRPVLVSHTGVRGAYDNVRNLSDEHARAVAAAGGILGVGYWKDAIGAPSPMAVARTAAYLAELVGIEHVALGSDFDGGVRTPLDASELPAITQALLDVGLDAEAIARIMGGNAVEFFARALPAAVVDVPPPLVS